jgi:alkaline phosphatase
MTWRSQVTTAHSRSRRTVGALITAALAITLVPSAIADAKPSPARAPEAKVKNVIVMISDGWGYEHIAATNYYTQGKMVAQDYELFPVRTAMTTYAHPSVGGGYDPMMAWADFNYVKMNPTDSAAAATAMSTGIKTYNAGIGVDIDQQPAQHILEAAEKLGKATGVVSSVQLSHATPAAHVAHNSHRNNYAAIANEMFHDSAADVIMGAGHPFYTDSGAPRVPTSSNYNFVGGQTTWDALVAGTVGADADGDGLADPFTLVQTKAEFEALAAGPTPKRVAGVPQVATTLQQSRAGDATADPYVVPFNADVPTLETMTRAALNVLDEDKDGLFLMVEGGAVDWAGHANQKGRVIEEQADFNAAVDAVIGWVEANSNWGETLLIVTGDHETGYLTGPGSGQFASGPLWTPLANYGIGMLPGMQFNSGDHTNALIPLYAKGSAARHLRSASRGMDPVRGAYMDNTDIAKIAFSTMK